MWACRRMSGLLLEDMDEVDDWSDRAEVGVVGADTDWLVRLWTLLRPGNRGFLSLLRVFAVS